MNSDILRQKFLDFFKTKGHKIVPSSSLLPSDPSVLFTTAGMQQFSLYLAGKKDVVKDFGSRHLASCQKCFRTGDIDEIGDDTHHTFFEMLGNWSIGQDENGYFKEKAIEYALEFLIDELKLEKEKMWITVFGGDKDIPADNESISFWQKQGISEERIIAFDRKDNFWGPVSNIGPCGPCSEIHYDRGDDFGCDNVHCGPNCSNCKRFVEIWNLVFMEYFKTEKGGFEKLPQTNVDTGIGFERLASLLQSKNSAYESDILYPIIRKIEEVSSLKYQEYKKEFRIIADHIRGAVFISSENIIPSNLGQGYVLRRILRRAIRYGKMIDSPKDFLIPLIKLVVDKYKEVYPELEAKEAEIIETIKKEEERFEKTLQSGLFKIEKILEERKNRIISGEEAFDLYQSYGFPLELTEEIIQERGFVIEKQSFEQALKKHQEISRAGVEKKFGGIGEADEEKTRLHTANHLLHSALRKILGNHVEQMGSDITSKRLRFDFKHPQKLTEEEKKKVEDLVNEQISQDLIVENEEMPLKQALESGALAFFKEKYPETVTVWTIKDKNTGEVFSKEICAGPHVKSLQELGKFEIIKEESSSSGIRRIKAILK